MDSNADEASKNYLIAMLEELLKKENAEQKKQKLVENYGFIMSDETGRRINVMCNLSEVILEQGIEQGIEQGLRSMVQTVKSLVGDDFEKVSEIIRKNDIYASLSDEEIRKYW